jgi:hypothetical protein
MGFLSFLEKPAEILRKHRPVVLYQAAEMPKLVGQRDLPWRSVARVGGMESDAEQRQPT